jgi:serine/threonine protein kinase
MIKLATWIQASMLTETDDSMQSDAGPAENRPTRGLVFGRLGIMESGHPTEKILRAHRRGTLEANRAAAVAAHVRGCTICSARLDGLADGDPIGGGSEVERRKTVVERVVDGAETLIVPELPDYEIVRCLGEGGMGVVYLAKNLLMGRLEVLKVLGRHLVSQPEAMDRFLREIQSAARIQHKNIVSAYSALRWNGGLILAMEYVEGQDLSDRVEARGPLPVAEACYFIHQAAWGLEQAHRAGMVHRDIKPANLMLDLVREKGTIKILDFGLAKVTSESGISGGLTRQGLMLGTPEYMAPEQIRDPQMADVRADIYSLGCTLYFLLAGRPPFDGNSLYDIFQAHHSNEASPLNLVRSDVPAALAALVAKMMAKEPGHRFQAPALVAKALIPFFKPGSVFPGAARDGSAAPRTSKHATILEETPASRPKPARHATVSENTEEIEVLPPKRKRQRTIVEPGSAATLLPPRTSQTILKNPSRPSKGSTTERSYAYVPFWSRTIVLASVGVVVAAMIGINLWSDGPPPRALSRRKPSRPGTEKSYQRTLASMKAATRVPVPIAPAPIGIADDEPKIELAKRAELIPPPNMNPAPPTVVSPEPPRLESTGAPKPDPDGLVYADYRKVAATPGMYQGLKIVPNEYLLASAVRSTNPVVPGFGTLKVVNQIGQTLSGERATTSYAGGQLGIVLEPNLASSLKNYMDGNKRANPGKHSWKIIPTLEIRRSEHGSTAPWLAVVTSVKVVAQHNANLFSGRRDNVFSLKIIDGARVTDQPVGEEFYDYLDGNAERAKLVKAYMAKLASADRKIQEARLNSLIQSGVRDAAARNAMDAQSKTAQLQRLFGR